MVASSQWVEAGAEARACIHSRSMSEAEKAIVSTARGLRQALKYGSPHIEIIQHLDLAALTQLDSPAPLPADDVPGTFTVIPRFTAPPTVRSVQVHVSMLFAPVSSLLGLSGVEMCQIAHEFAHF